MGLIQQLREMQGERSLIAFASEIGLSHSTLSRLYRGKTQLRRDKALAIVAHKPELREAIEAYFSGRNRAA